MTQRYAELESEFEDEFEGELEGEDEFEGEGEGEEFLSTLGNLAKGFLGEGEDEFEEELEFEGEFEDEGEGEEFLSTLGGLAKGLLGEGEYEDEGEDEGEEFFRRIGRFVRKNAGLLKRIAKIAAPLVGTALGGPLGGTIGGLAARALGEGEFEDEFEGEFEGEDEFEAEAEAEAGRPLSENEAMAELMAAVAAHAESEAEAEAMIGAATMTVLSPRDRAALHRILPNLVRATCVLARLLRRQPATRPAVRLVPTIVRRTSRVLAARGADGRPITRRTAARVMARQTRTVLGSPRRTTSALARNVRAARAVQRSGQPTSHRRYRRPHPSAAQRNGVRRRAYL